MSAEEDFEFFKCLGNAKDSKAGSALGALFLTFGARAGLIMISYKCSSPKSVVLERDLVLRLS
jgi:hypothetical protein